MDTLENVGVWVKRQAEAGGGARHAGSGGQGSLVGRRGGVPNGFQLLPSPCVTCVCVWSSLRVEHALTGPATCAGSKQAGRAVVAGT